MKKSLLEYLCCPINHQELKLVSTISDNNDEIIEGKLISSIGLEYRIKNGIPNLLPCCSNLQNSNENQNSLYTTFKPYILILEKIGMDSLKIAQMDSLRYSIYYKTKQICSKHMGGIVLEIGAGGNYLKSEFKSLYNVWISLDYDLRLDSIDLRGDGQQLPLKNGIFDTIISIDVLEHVPNPEKFVSEMFRVIKPGGIVILSTPFFFYLHDAPFDFFRFSKFGLTTIFQRIGFEVIEVEPTAGVISIIGILISIFITKVFMFSTRLLKIMLAINQLIQIKLLLPIDKKLDKNNRFAQGHFIVAKKIEI